MILQDSPQKSEYLLPADQLTDEERLNRLFMDTGKRWRLLAVFSENTGAGRLLIPELKSLVSEFGPRGLVSRVVYLGVSKFSKLETEVRRWLQPNTRATGLDIHASRIIDKRPLPALNLYDPEGMLRFSMEGFDTEKGLDDLFAFIEEHLTRKQC